MNDSGLHDLIARYIRAFFPTMFRRLKTVSDRGHWVTTNYDQKGYEAGLFLNRITLYKATAEMHTDHRDGFCVTCCGGNFSGGELVLPDVGLKFL